VGADHDPSRPDDLRRLKESAGADIVCTGSIQLTHQLTANDLVDEYRLFLYPTAAGAGRRLVEDAINLRLTACRPFPSGVVLLIYRRD
jgi:dihydrofolate reductase